jgi:hypothetical protein
MSKPCLGIRGGTRRQRLLEGRCERLARAGLGVPPGRFEFRPALLHRGESGGVRRPILQTCAPSPKGRGEPSPFRHGPVVHDDEVARP